jgi:dolichol-phosphate mannosyltransferase
MSKILVFTATYNEKDNVEKLINVILKLGNDIKMLVIDDKSPDKTYEILEKISKKNDNLIVVKREKKLGLNTAHIMAYEYALKNNYDKLITLDADFSHDPNEITKIIGLLDKYDFVIGSRYIKGGKNTQPVFRYLISYLGNKLIKLILKINLNEFTTSYRGFNIKKLNNFNLNQIKGKGYSFFMETIIVLNRLGYKCFEFPIQFNDRVHGKSKIPKIEIFRTFKNLILLFLKK